MVGVGDAGLDPCAAPEQAQQECLFDSAVDSAGVFARLIHEPGGEAVVVVLVWSQSELQSVDPVLEGIGALPVGLQGCIDPARLVVELRTGVCGQLSSAEAV